MLDLEILEEHGAPSGFVAWVGGLEGMTVVGPGHDRVSPSMPQVLRDDYGVSHLGSMRSMSWNKDERRGKIDAGYRKWTEACTYSRNANVQRFKFTMLITDFDPDPEPLRNRLKQQTAVDRMCEDGFIPYRVLSCPMTGGVQTHHRMVVPVSHRNRERMRKMQEVRGMLASRYGGDPLHTNMMSGYSQYSSFMWSLEMQDGEDIPTVDMDQIHSYLKAMKPVELDLNDDVRCLVDTTTNIHEGNRNVSLFNDLRNGAYRTVRNYHDRGQFMDHLLRSAFAWNLTLSVPLPEWEVRATALSVGRFCWDNRHRFMRRSAKENGHRSGEIRALRANLGAMDMAKDIYRGKSMEECLEIYGISRSTYYNWRKRSGQFGQ